MDPSRRLKVLHILSGDLWAGAATSTFTLASAQTRLSSTEPGALLLNCGDTADRFRSVLPGPTILDEKTLSFPILVQRCRQLARRYDLVHTHGYKEHVLGALSGRPWIATQHGLPESTRGLPALRRSFYLAGARLLMRVRAGHVLAVSADVRDWLRPWIPRERMSVVHNGVDAALCDRMVPPLVDRPRRVGVLARLYPVKQIEIAIAAVSRLRGVELEIVGEGPERARLESLAAAAGAREKVLFRGFQPDPLPLVARWRALLVTSKHEGSPMCVLEALALGTPVIMAPLGKYQEHILGAGGQVTAGWDPEEWAQVVQAVVDNPQNWEKRSRLARSRVREQFSAEAVAKHLVEVYGEVLVGPISGSRE